MINVNDRPTICNICGGRVVYGNMTDYQIKPFQSGKCYICTSCGAYVGTHIYRPMDALGVLADSETRALRAKCHEEFDRHYMSLTARNTLYYMLSVEMGIKKEECHFGYFGKEELLKAMDIMQNKWEKLYIR